MVGIVLVSHSRALATALVDLVRQMNTGDVPLAISAGVGDDRQEFGTDAIELMEAILAVFSSDGVLVLMDLGSAVLSAETALDLLPPEVSEKVRLCPAPFVEGSIAAAVQAGLGSDLETVFAEARSALRPKLEQIDVADERPAISDVEAPSFSDGASVELVVRNLHGLHARPAARFVKAAAGYQSDIQVFDHTNNKGPVSAKSLNALATLGAVKGHQIRITARGADAEPALKTLSEMVESGFGEVDQAPIGESNLPPSGQPGAELAVQTGDAIAGEGLQIVVPVSEGVALGPFYRYRPPLPPVSSENIADPQTAWEQLQQAILVTRSGIQQRGKKLAASLGDEQAAIFDAHEMILQDPDLLDRVHKLIFEQNLNPAAAWKGTIDSTAADYLALDDEYLKQRAVDVNDVGNQVLFALAGKVEGLRIELRQPVILFADELTPTETSSLDMSKVLGLMTVGGGPTSHSAILARALGIPAISGVSRSLETLEDDTLVGLDGFQGRVWVDPQEVVQAELLRQREDWLAERERLQQSGQELGMTRDGVRVEVVANVGNVLDADSAAANGAEGIGLLRTEFLFITRTEAPTEEEQYRLLVEIGAALNKSKNTSWPMIVRTLDVGGDKELPYVQLEPEANPFLGVRALRLSLRKPELFTPQLRAILRAGAEFHFRIMYPMVANLSEVLQARQALEAVHQALERENIPHGWPVETGIMVEIPSAAILSPILAPHVDFFSIGTNDLTQYTLAAERGNPLLSGLADALHPAVLHLVKQVAEAAHENGKFTGVCGELAGDPLAVPILVGLGVDELSMNPGGIPRAKAILRTIDLAQAQQIASQALLARSAEEVRTIAKVFYDEYVSPKM
jgi:multiphosphoryl transfer protein